MDPKSEQPVSGQSEQTAFELTLLGRLVQVMTSEAGPTSAGRRLEELLQSIPQLPWFKTFAVALLPRLDALSDRQWSQKFITFWERCAPMISRWYIEKGEDDPLWNLTPVEKARFVAKLCGRSKLRWFISDVRIICRDALEKVSQGGSNNLSLNVETSGLFTEDLAKGLELMNLVFYLSGGKTLVDQVLEAAQLIKKTMNSQMALMAAMEIAEKQYKWTSPTTEKGFRNTWDSMESKLVHEIDIHGLIIPGTRLSVKNSSYKEHWEEELAFLQESVFEDLLKRIKRDPMKVVRDAMEGKLLNSLAMAVLNDLRDHIKFLRAQKRDVKKEMFTSSLEICDLVYPENLTPNKIAQAVNSPSAAEMSFEEMIEGLNDIEKEVLTLIFVNEMPENMVAVQMHKSASWVTKTKNKAIEKLYRELLAIEPGK